METASSYTAMSETNVPRKARRSPKRAICIAFIALALVGAGAVSAFILIKRPKPVDQAVQFQQPVDPRALRPEGLTTYYPSTNFSSSFYLLNPADFTSWIDDQVKNKGQKVLALAQGDYQLTECPEASEAHFAWSEWEGVTIWMDQVTMRLHTQRCQAFNFYQLKRVTVYGPWGLAWNTPGFSQGTVISVSQISTSPPNYTMEVELDAGYNSSYFFKTGQFSAQFYNPVTKTLYPGNGWSSIQAYQTSPGDNPNRKMIDTTIWSGPLPSSGDKLLARGDFIFCNIISRSEQVSWIDYTLWNCAGFSFFSTANTANFFKRVRIEVAPFPPPGGTVLPVRASSADGFHSAGDVVGPTWEDVYISDLDDDCIAVHGSFYEVTSYNPGDDWFACHIWALDLVYGDNVRMYDGRTNTLRIPGTFTINTFQYIPNTDSIFNISLNEPLPEGFQVGYGLAVMKALGNGFAIRNVHCNRNRGRGFLIKAWNGMIENNRIDDVTYGAITIGPEISYWGETDYVVNVTVRNNIINHCNYINKAGAAFHLHGDGIEPIGGNLNITITDNIIMNVTSTMMYIGSTSGITLARNKFLNIYPDDYTLWQNYPDAVVVIANTTDLIFKDNCAEAPLRRNVPSLVRIGTVSPSDATADLAAGIQVKTSCD